MQNKSIPHSHIGYQARTNLKPEQSYRDFGHRFSHGREFEARVSAYLQQTYVCEVLPSDLIGVGSPKLRKHLTQNRTPEACFLRYLPDFLVVSEEHSMLVEVKSTLTNSEYYSVNYAEFLVQLTLARDLNLLLFLVFPGSDSEPDFRGCQITNITLESSGCSESILASANGSRLPYRLVRKADIPLLTESFDRLFPRRDELEVLKTERMRFPHVNALYGDRGYWV